MQKKGKNINQPHSVFVTLADRKKQSEREIMRLVQEFFWKNWSKVVMFQGEKNLKLQFLDHPI
jgi:hypothetical protein